VKQCNTCKRRTVMVVYENKQGKQDAVVACRRCDYLNNWPSLKG